MGCFGPFDLGKAAVTTKKGIGKYLMEWISICVAKKQL
jgi:hypothetical protein